MPINTLLQKIQISRNDSEYTLSIAGRKEQRFTIEQKYSTKEMSKEDVIFNVIGDVHLYFDGYTFEEIAAESSFDPTDEYMLSIHKRDQETIRKLRQLFSEEELSLLIDWAK